jgi:hypothetical protein
LNAKMYVPRGLNVFSAESAVQFQRCEWFTEAILLRVKFVLRSPRCKTEKVFVTSSSHWRVDGRRAGGRSAGMYVCACIGAKCGRVGG